jgi:hypothetical protein
MMKLEAINQPILYRWPGGQIHFLPGVPVEVPEERGMRILAKAAGRVRLASWNPIKQGASTVKVQTWRQSSLSQRIPSRS